MSEELNNDEKIAKEFYDELIGLIRLYDTVKGHKLSVLVVTDPRYNSLTIVREERVFTHVGYTMKIVKWPEYSFGYMDARQKKLVTGKGMYLLSDLFHLVGSIQEVKYSK